MPFLLRSGCRIAYTKSPALWGRHADVVYLPGMCASLCIGCVRVCWCPGEQCSPLVSALKDATNLFNEFWDSLPAAAGMASTMHG